MKEKKDPKVGCIMMLVVFANIVPVMIWRGYVLQSLWEWFFLPLGLPMVGIIQAIGVSMTISYLAGTSSLQEAVTRLSRKEEEDEDATANLIGKLVTGWVGPLFILGIAKALTHWL